MIIIRVDSSIHMGAGHVMRCLTLANALRNHGKQVEFICHPHRGNLVDLIRHEHGFLVHILEHSAEVFGNDQNSQEPNKINWQQDVEQTLAILREKERVVELVIVDHYALDYRWEFALRKDVRKIMVIDDLADRKHDCDVLLDQNFYLTVDRYQGLLPEHCIQLLGTKFILLRAEFETQRTRVKTQPSDSKHLLICFGGSDPENETGKALAAVEGLEKSNFSVDVILGSQNPNQDKILEQIKNIPRANCIIQANNMAELLFRADLALGAVGTTTWERCAMGVPTIVTTTAANQVEVTESLAKMNIVHYIGEAIDSTPEHYLKAIREVLLDVHYYRSMAVNGMNLVDGKGIHRVMQSISELA